MSKETKQNETNTANQQPAPQPEQGQPVLTELEQALTEENEKLIEENDRLKAENEKLQKRCSSMQDSADKSDTYLTQLVAMKNDFESYKRRMKFNSEQAKAEGIQNVITKLLAVTDTFELAKKHLRGNDLKAFEMVNDQFLGILADFGVKEMEVMGEIFDHTRMSALSKTDRGEENQNRVVEVYRKGYTFGDKVLRYAEVIVGA